MIRPKLFRETIIVILMILVVILPRFIGVSEFVQNDEPDWVRRGANFYFAMGQREFENTIQDYHPAITTLWAGAISTWFYFPEHRASGEYFDWYEAFERYIIHNGEDSLALLEGGRIVLLIGNSILFVLFFYLMRELVGLLPATVATLVLSFDPFHFGFTRLMAHEGMLSLALMTSLAAFLLYFYKGRNVYVLAISTFTTAVGMLSKSPGIIMVLFVGFIFFVEIISNLQSGEGDWVNFLKDQIKVFGIWLLELSGFYFILWPGMWIAPREMLSYVYGTAFSYASIGQRLEVKSDPNLNVSFFKNLVNRSASFWDDILWTLTPVVWFGLILAVVILFFYYRKQEYSLPQRTMAYFIWFGVFYFFMNAVSRGRNPQHYIMTTFSSFDIAAGMGMVFVGDILVKNGKGVVKKYGQWLVLVVLIGLQVAGWYSYYPYFVNYCNPVMEAVNGGGCEQKAGYGEGLDLAAAYLSNKSNAEDLTVLSWWGIGGVSYFFPGEVELIPVSPKWTEGLTDKLKRSDYLVVYYVVQHRWNQPASLMAALEGVEPEHRIWLNDVEYVRIYAVGDLPDVVFIPDFE